MLHDLWFYLFIVETFGYSIGGIWIALSLARLRAHHKPPAKSPPQPGSLRERMQQ